MLLDQLVCGVRDLRLQRCLLSKADLNLKAAIEEAQTAEMSTLSAAEIQGTSSYLGGRTNAAVHYQKAVGSDFYDKEEEINRLKWSQPTQRRNNPDERRQITSCLPKLWRQSSKSHRNMICLKCQRKGHLARMCQAGKSLNQPAPYHSQPKTLKLKKTALP
ncbi:hypothetical protein E2320_007842 [Naja naja]|nr:hypothetical protein E2320_007842 [Naja naja]